MCFMLWGGFVFPHKAKSKHVYEQIRGVITAQIKSEGERRICDEPLKGVASNGLDEVRVAVCEVVLPAPASKDDSVSIPDDYDPGSVVLALSDVARVVEVRLCAPVRQHRLHLPGRGVRVTWGYYPSDASQLRLLALCNRSGLPTLLEESDGT